MKVWLPYVQADSGIDVFTDRLAGALRELGHEVVVSRFAHGWQYFPWRLRLVAMPRGTDVILANTWNGFAFARPGARLVVVEHHCVLDPAYVPYRSMRQALFHEGLLRRFELASFAAASAVVAVSHFTARSLHRALGVADVEVVHNGVDTDLFAPGTEDERASDPGVFRLLFVGNLSSRKGADLLVPVMRRLGPGFELRYTGGLRGERSLGDAPNICALGRLDDERLRAEYRRADALLFPTRFEGFGYAAAEAMACGTPVIGSNASSLPELVVDGETGVLCGLDDLDSFVDAARALADDRDRARALGSAARERAVQKFSIARMAQDYGRLVQRVTGEGSAMESGKGCGASKTLAEAGPRRRFASVLYSRPVNGGPRRSPRNDKL